MLWVCKRPKCAPALGPPDYHAGAAVHEALHAEAGLLDLSQLYPRIQMLAESTCSCSTETGFAQEA